MYGQDELTSRERQIVTLVIQGLRNKHIAVALGIEESTVENHLHHIFQKLHVANRTEAAVTALRSGIVQDEDQ